MNHRKYDFFCKNFCYQAMKNQKGMGLIETVIAAAVGLVVIGIISKSFLFQMDQVSRLEERQTTLSLQSYLSSLFSSPKICEKNFKGKKVQNVTPFKNLRFEDNKSFFQKSGKYQAYENLKINQIRLNNMTAPLGSSGSGIMELETQLMSQKSRKLLKPAKVLLQVRTNNRGEIIQCALAGTLGNDSSLPDGECRSLNPATPDTIYPNRTQETFTTSGSSCDQRRCYGGRNFYISNFCMDGRWVSASLVHSNDDDDGPIILPKKPSKPKISPKLPKSPKK